MMLGRVLWLHHLILWHEGMITDGILYRNAALIILNTDSHVVKH